MRLLSALLLAFGVTMGSVAAASAADFVIYDQQPAAFASYAGDWSGPYVGVGATAASSAIDNFGQLEVIAGMNVQADSFVFGFEGWLGGFWSDAPDQDAVVGAQVRGGVLLTPEVLMYASLGGQHFINGGASYAQVGAGVEFMLTDSVSVDLEGKLWNGLNLDNTAVSASASVLFHF